MYPAVMLMLIVLASSCVSTIFLPVAVCVVVVDYVVPCCCVVDIIVVRCVVFGYVPVRIAICVVVDVDVDVNDIVVVINVGNYVVIVVVCVIICGGVVVIVDGVYVDGVRVGECATGVVTVVVDVVIRVSVVDGCVVVVGCCASGCVVVVDIDGVIVRVVACDGAYICCAVIVIYLGDAAVGVYDSLLLLSLCIASSGISSPVLLTRSLLI